MDNKNPETDRTPTQPTQPTPEPVYIPEPVETEQITDEVEED